MKATTKKQALELLSSGTLNGYALEWLDRKVGGELNATHTDGRTLSAANCYDLMVAGGWGRQPELRAGWRVEYRCLGHSVAVTPDVVMKAVYVEGDAVNAQVERAEGMR